MKKLFGLLAFVIIFVNIINAQKFSEGTTAWSYALSGLKIRDIADTKGKIIDTIPYGNSFQVLKQENPAIAFTSDGIPGNWIKVKYNNVTGYLFDGYATKYPPPAKTNQESGKNYLTKNFAIKEEKKEFTDCSDCSLKLTFDNAIVYTQKENDEAMYSEEIFVFPEMTIYEGFVFLLAYDHLTRGLTLGNIVEEGLNEDLDKVFTASVSKKIKLSETDVIDSKFDIILIKDQNNRPIKLTICYFYGAGYSTITIQKNKSSGILLTIHNQAD